MLALPLLAGLLALLAVVAGAVAVRSLPARRACPDCHNTTFPVRRPLLRALSFVVCWRWCPRCGWSGWSRRRTPEPGEESRDLRTAFEWGEGPGRARPRPRAFRWKGRRVERATSVEADSVDPSGFRWAEADSEPSGFRWGG